MTDSIFINNIFIKILRKGKEMLEVYSKAGGSNADAAIAEALITAFGTGFRKKRGDVLLIGENSAVHRLVCTGDRWTA